MLTDCELMATCLAGGLGVTRERLVKTLVRLIRPSPGGDQRGVQQEHQEMGNPLNTAAVAQALRELTDIWQGFFNRQVRFMEIERLLTKIKDKILDGCGSNPQALLIYQRLAQNLNDLRLSSTEENSNSY
jgi:hypothetical protein